MPELVQIVSPVDGSVYAERPRASEAEVDAALEAARAAQRDWAQTPIAERAEVCAKAVAEMLEMRDDIIIELAWQMGRPVRYGGGELAGFEERARAMIAIAEEALAPIELPPKPGFKRRIERAPLGLVLVIAPWNYPYLTAVNSVIPALMAGNAVILKHASQTLLVGERFQAAFDRAGLPAGLFRNLVLAHDQVARLLSSGAVDRVNFTGSVEAGRSIAQTAAQGFVGVGLELGGKDPAYVRADADLGPTVENLVDGAYFNSGQSCCGIERIYVEKRIYEDFLEAFVDLTNKYVLDDPLKAETTLGPMATARAADKVRSEIGAAIAKGARAHVERQLFRRDAPGTAYLAPEVLTDVDHDMTIMTEETFGPVVGIMAIDGEREAIRLMNDSRYGLTASVWTSDEEAAERIAGALETGTVFMNRCDYLDPLLAWTGVKDSGMGATLSRVGYEALTRPKSFHFRKTL